MHDLSHGSEIQPASETLARVLERIEGIRAAQRQQGETPLAENQARVLAAGRAEVDRLLRIARVPELYRDAQWDRVRSPAIREWSLGIKARTPKNGDAGPPNYALLGHGMMILGPTGTGKSSAAALVARETLAAGRNVAWRYVPDLLDTMTSGARERTPELRRLSLVDVLILDDFGVREIADWEVGYMDQIMEARYRTRKPVVITSNLTAQQIMADQRLERMVDRWRERTASSTVILAGESMRNQKGRTA